MNSVEADKHHLSDQVDQLQSKLDRAALHRDLIVGMDLQKKDPRVSGYQNGQVLYKQPQETLTKDAFESLAHTSTSGEDSTERTARGFSGASPSRLQLMQRFKHS
jgi:hypothetical protein